MMFDARTRRRSKARACDRPTSHPTASSRDHPMPTLSSSFALLSTVSPVLKRRTHQARHKFAVMRAVLDDRR
jgi:hypothetical protein